MKSRSINDATGSIILIKTLCANMLTLSQLLGKASLSNVEAETLKNWDRREAKLSLPSISKLDSKKLRICFFGEDSTRTRNTMAVSPNPGLNIRLPSLVRVVCGAFLDTFGRSDTKENGYDSGNVTGTGIAVVVGDLVRSTARWFAGFWNSRYESNNLHASNVRINFCEIVTTYRGKRDRRYSTLSCS